MITWRESWGYNQLIFFFICMSNYLFLCCYAVREKNTVKKVFQNKVFLKTKIGLYTVSKNLNTGADFTKGQKQAHAYNCLN